MLETLRAVQPSLVPSNIETLTRGVHPSASNSLAGKYDARPLSVYGYAPSPRVLAVLIVAAYESLPLQLVRTHPAGAQHGFRAEPYASHFPFGRVPGFSHGNFFLAETQVIITYLAELENNAGLLGDTVEDRALVQQWVAFANSMLFPTMQPWLDPVRDHAPYNKAAIDAARAATTRIIGILDNILAAKSSYLVGDKRSLGDIMLASVIGRGCKYLFGKAFRAKHPHVFRHYELVANDPVYASQAGAVTFLDEEVVPKAAGAAEEAVHVTTRGKGLDV